MKAIVSKAACQKCGKIIPMGTTRYKVAVEITSDFDGFLPEYMDEEEEINRTVEEADELDEEELEADIHQEFMVVLCRSCMHALVDDLKGGAGIVRPKIRTRYKLQ